jgi:serine/threonine protein kinase
VGTATGDNAALALEGRTLPGEWIVGPLNVANPSATGGFFSVSYLVSRPDGQKGFLKVIDLATVIHDLGQLQAAVNEYISEKDLLVMCGEQRLSRVVTAIDYGQFALPEFPIPYVNYIIFELATSDIRIAISQSTLIDTVIKLQMLHDLAAGLRQLHRFRVAHQDLKPSNFLVFDEVDGATSRGKIADLGRAYRQGVPSMHDSFAIPGHKLYAPPEQLYGHEYTDSSVRRFSADLYQLGSLAAYIFGGVTMNALLARELAPEHHWNAFGDTFADVLPYLEDAHDRAVERLRDTVVPEIGEKLPEVIRYLTLPNATRRGHPTNQRGRGAKFSLERVVTELDLLLRRTSLTVGRSRP